MATAFPVRASRWSTGACVDLTQTLSSSFVAGSSTANASSIRDRDADVVHVSDSKVQIPRPAGSCHVPPG